MRTFFPLLPGDLCADRPKLRGPITIEVPDGLKDEAIDELHEAALDEAAFLSLALLMDDGGPSRRVVAVSDVDSPAGWSECAAIYVDDVQVAQLVKRARNAGTQQELDELAQLIAQSTMDWYDVSELAALRSLFDC